MEWREAPYRTNISFFIFIMFFAVFGVIILTELLPLERPNKLTKSRNEHLQGWDGKTNSASDKDETVPPVHAPLDAVWQPVNGTRFRFYVYSAYVERRTVAAVRIIAATKTRGADSVLCRLWLADNRTLTLNAKVEAIRENWELKYSAAYVLCLLGGSGVKPQQTVGASVAVVSTKKPNDPPTNLLVVLDTEATAGTEETLHICVRPFHCSFKRKDWLVEWFEINRLLGASHFYMYNESLSPTASCLLDDYRKQGLVTMLSWRLPFLSKVEIRSEGQSVSFNDCLYRSMSRAGWLLVIDVDEVVFPRRERTLPALLTALRASYNPPSKAPSAFLFRNAFFYAGWEDDPEAKSPLLTARKTRRSETPHALKIRSKYALRPREAVELGCHFVWELVPSASSVGVNNDRALLHHYRMALDVRLSRDVDEPWGFQIFGGVDDEMPLTVQKIEPESPAKRAGLLNGDHILTINGEEAIDMTVAAASRRVEESGHSLTVGVLRGLYDPVLDDTEPLCYDYEDVLGRQSEPTEVVFQIQQFVEPSDLGSHPIDFDSSPGLTGSRSLTASPYLTPTKPYRPFSTEPIVEVPPLEDPIILNPNYRDEFGKSPVGNDPDYLINAFGQREVGESKYKLPISEQYDPDGTRFKQNKEVTEKLLKYEKHVKSLSKDLQVVDVTTEAKIVDAVTGEVMSKDVRRESLRGDVKVEKKGVRISEEVSKHEESMRKDSKSIERKKMFKEEVEEESIREELQYIEKMRQEIDVEKIEETAMSIVEESIETAVSVAENVKKEIDAEMSSSEVQQHSELKSVKSEKTQESSEIIDKTESKEYTERKMSREERTETQKDGSQKIERKDYKESEISEKVTKDGKDVHRKSVISEEYQHEEVREQSRRESSESSENKLDVKAKFKKAAKTVASSVKGEKSTTAEQRAYTMGLQTIPNIRGIVHSSYHYDLLLRTFFLHLTDVMVALSRFLLSQPILNQLEQSSVSETRRYESGERDERVRKSSQEVVEKVEKGRESTMKVAESKQARRQLVTPVPVEKKQEVKSVSQKIEKDMKVESIQETKVEKKEIVRPVPVKEVKQELNVEKVQKTEKVITGAEMAQRSDKRLTPEVTQKLDAVISEFQTIAVEDVKKEMLMKNRRSRSRNQIEDEVMKESDPLEWLDKVDSRRTSLERTEMSEKSSETMEKKSYVETIKQDTKHKTSKSPKQTYVAIVESHVYTNKDAIFEEHLTDTSETSSVQSAEEINTAVETIETISAENVAIDSAIKELETAKIVEETHKLVTVKAESAATVQKIEEVLHDTKELVSEEFKKETAKQSTGIQEVVIQETKEIVEPVLEIKEEKLEKVEKVAIGINESLFVAESTEASVQESNSEFANVEMKKETVAIVEEKREVEKIVETKPEVIVPKPIEVVHITETIKIKPKEEKPVHEEFAALKIVKRVEIDANLSPEIIEVEDISELISKTAVSKVQVGGQVAIDASKEMSAKSYVNTQIGSEAKKESILDVSQASQMSVRSDIVATSQAKKESVTDIASQTTKRESLVDVETSQVSSQTAASAVKKEMAMTQHVESVSKSFEPVVQESSFTAQYTDRKLSLRTDLERQLSTQSPPSTIDTLTPSTIPPTPGTDEYVFKLSLPLPKSRSATPIPRDSTQSPEDEDPHIVKKHLIPHIETTIESVVYDPPLPTPTVEQPQSPIYTKPVLNGGGASKIRPFYCKPGLKGGAGRVRFPVYRKPGLFGGADKPEYSKEEIREIERKSSLLASAIDETIKSIEEYKEEVGIDTKKEVKVQEFKEEKVTKNYQESYSKQVRKGSRQNGFEEIDTKIEEIIERCNALASLENGENNTNFGEPENTGIVTEVEEKESRKASIEIEVKHESETVIEQQAKPKENTVKFESEVKIVEVENAGDTIIVTERKETLPEDVPYIPPYVQTPAVEIKPIEEVPPIVIIPETPLEVKPEPVRIQKEPAKEKKPDALLGFRPVVFDPENIQKRGGGQYYDTSNNVYIQEPPTITRDPRLSPYLTESGDKIGTIQGIVDGLEEPVMDPEIAKLLGKPGMPEEHIKPIISGEDDMLREAHVMGLARVLNSHMHRTDDPTSEILPIKPMIGSLKDSEVIKALNEEMLRQKEEERKKEEKKWTTFLQKPKRPVPKAKFGYHGWTEDDHVVAEPYKVKIVKQAKPKVAPDYKPEDFETGPLPWEQRAELDSSLPPPEPEEPILIPEVPEFLEAVDPLKESEVPDLEDTGIPLPPPREPTPLITEEQLPEAEAIPEVAEVQEVVQEEEKQDTEEDLERTMADQLVKSVQKMVDPNASLDQQLVQMRAQLAALAQIPEVIQQSLELVTQQLSKMSHQESHVEAVQASYQQEAQHEMETIQEMNESTDAAQNDVQRNEANRMTIEEVQEQTEMQQMQAQQMQQMQAQENMRMTPIMSEEDIRNEKQRKEQEWIEHESRLVKQHPTPRVAAAKPKRMFGPLDPDEARAVVLPGGRRWRQQQDVYDEQMIKEMFEKQSEVIKGKAIGINFMKYEKPPVSLDHLKHSEVFKLVHDEDQMPPRKVAMRTPVMCEADYRERCRSMTPAVENKHLQIPQQFHP